MSDALYLSLWYPNLRLEGLSDKVVAVLGEFAKHGGEARVYSATVWPIDWQESPVFQRVWGRAAGPHQPDQPPSLGAEPRQAVGEAMELLHDDYAYEFQIGWSLWEMRGTSQPSGHKSAAGGPGGGQGTEGTRVQEADGPGDASSGGAGWARVMRLVRVTGYGPLFDEGIYEQEGHIRIDFGSDAPFLEEESELDSTAARHMAENVRQLVDLTNDLEKNSGATARLLWSELGESLAQRLAARLNQGN